MHNESKLMKLVNLYQKIEVSRLAELLDDILRLPSARISTTWKRKDCGREHGRCAD